MDRWENIQTTNLDTLKDDARFPNNPTASTKVDHLFFFCDCGKVEMHPTSALDKHTREVTFMHALLDQDNGGMRRIVLTTKER